MGSSKWKELQRIFTVRNISTLSEEWDSQAYVTKISSFNSRENVKCWGMLQRVIFNGSPSSSPPSIVSFVFSYLLFLDGVTTAEKWREWWSVAFWHSGVRNAVTRERSHPGYCSCWTTMVIPSPCQRTLFDSFLLPTISRWDCNRRKVKSEMKFWLLTPKRWQCYCTRIRSSRLFWFYIFKWKLALVSLRYSSYKVRYLITHLYVKRISARILKEFTFLTI